MRVAVVGGGIAGLSAAWELRDRASVVVFEPDRLGGKLRSEPFGDRTVDSGPDAFIARVPEGIELAEELGLSSELESPAAGRTLLWWRGRLRQLPDGLILGVPRQLVPVAFSGLLSPLGTLRAGLDLVLPRRPVEGDVSVHALVAGRFGAEVADRLVDPLIGSIHAGATAELSAEATAPQLVAVARRSRSLLLGLRQSGGPAGPAGDGPLFLAPRGGIQVLADRMVDRLNAAGVEWAHEAVTAVRVRDGRVEVDPVGEAFDAVVLAIPADRAASVLGDDAPARLSDIGFTSVTLVTLEYAAGALAVPDGANGILVPRPERALMTACSFASNKWPSLARDGGALLRVSTGWSGDRRADELDDSTLVERLSTEVTAMLGGQAEPLRWRVSRWPRSFPQYRVGHLQRVAAIEAALGRVTPQVALAGASYRGAGIPACIASGRAAAKGLVARAASPR